MLERRPGDGMELGSCWARLDAKLLPPLRLHHPPTERFPAMPDAGADHKVSRYPETKTGKRIAKTKLAHTKRAVEALQPADKPWIAWDDRLTGFGEGDLY